MSDKYIDYIDLEMQSIFRMGKDVGNKMELNRNRSQSLNIIED